MSAYAISQKNSSVVSVDAVKLLNNKINKELKNNSNTAILCDDKQKTSSSNVTFFKYRIIKCITSITNFIDKITNILFNHKFFVNKKCIQERNIIITKIENTPAELAKTKFIDPKTLEIIKLPKHLLSSFISYNKLQKIIKYIENNNLHISQDYIKNIIVLDKDYKKLELNIDSDSFTSNFLHDKHIFKLNNFVVDGEVNNEALKQIDGKALPVVLDWIIEQGGNILSFLSNLDINQLKLISNSNPDKIIDYLTKINKHEKNMDYSEVEALLEKHNLYTSKDDKAQKIQDIKATKYIIKEKQIDLEAILEDLQGEDLEDMLNYLVDIKIDISPYINQLNIEQLSVRTDSFLPQIVANIDDHSNINHKYLVELHGSLHKNITSALAEGILPITKETQTNINCYFKLINSGLIDLCKITQISGEPTLLTKFIEFKMYKEATKLLNSIKLSLDKTTLISEDIKNYLEDNIQGKNILLSILEDNNNIDSKELNFLLNLLKELNFNFNLKNKSGDTTLTILSRKSNYQALQNLCVYLKYDHYHEKNNNAESALDIVNKIANEDPNNELAIKCKKQVEESSSFTLQLSKLSIKMLETSPDSNYPILEKAAKSYVFGALSYKVIYDCLINPQTWYEAIKSQSGIIFSTLSVFGLVKAIANLLTSKQVPTNQMITNTIDIKDID